MGNVFKSFFSLEENSHGDFFSKIYLLQKNFVMGLPEQIPRLSLIHDPEMRHRSHFSGFSYEPLRAMLSGNSAVVRAMGRVPSQNGIVSRAWCSE